MKRITPLLALLLATACGQPPVPLEQEVHGPNDGHDHGPGPASPAGPVSPQGQMPQDDVHAAFQGGGATPSDAGLQGNPHAPSGATDGVTFAGFVRLTGERATDGARRHAPPNPAGPSA